MVQAPFSNQNTQKPPILTRRIGGFVIEGAVADRGKAARREGACAAHEVTYCIVRYNGISHLNPREPKRLAPEPALGLGSLDRCAVSCDRVA